jgi:hypothetical protein
MQVEGVVLPCFTLSETLMKLHSFSAVGLLALLLTPGCEMQSPVENEVRNDPAAPVFDFINGPLDLPNVLRGDSALVFAWADQSRNMVITINAPPAGAHEFRRCGGTLGPELHPVQTAGELHEVMRQLRVLRDVRIHVYQPVPAGFVGIPQLCAERPIAAGTGNVTSTDNDRLNEGSGTNAFGFRAQGVVELVSGGGARVTAVRQNVIRPDDTCCDVLVSSVMLHPQ